MGLLADNASGDAWKEWGLDAAQGRGFLRPLHIWLLKADSLVWGVRPLGFHLTATAAFVAAVLLVFLIAEALGVARSVAFGGALVLAVHPILAAVVPFVAAREETLTAALCLGSFYALLRARLCGTPQWPVLVCQALALLTKETAVAFLVMPALYDVVVARVWRGDPREGAAAMRLYAGLALLLAAYLALRFAAFGNVVGGDGAPTSFTSAEAFVRFHVRFARDLLGSRLLDVHGVPALRWLVVLGAVALSFLAVLAPVPDRLLLLRRLLLLGPCWYLVTTALFYGTYYDDRHHTLPLAGLVLAGTVAGGAALSRAGVGRRALAVGLVLAAAATLLLPVTLRAARTLHEASGVTERTRAAIETLTAGLPDGSAVLLVGTPLQEDPPFYFGWGLQSALKRPFTPTDAAARLRIVDRRSLAMNRSRAAVPRRFDLEIHFADHPPGVVDRVGRP